MTMTDIFLNQKRVNVCEHTVKMALHYTRLKLIVTHNVALLAHTVVMEVCSMKFFKMKYYGGAKEKDNRREMKWKKQHPITKE